MNIVFAMVGTSGLYNEDIGKGWNDKQKDNKLLRQAVDLYRYKDPKKDPEVWTDLFKNLVKAHLLFFQAPAGTQWKKSYRSRTSAELSSTHYLLQKVHVATVSKIVFLASDTPESKAAAEIIAEVEKTRVPRNIAVRHEHVSGLDREFQQDLPDALYRQVERHRPNGNENIIFNITGGFKGAIPAITLLAIECEWRLFYQHEEADFAVEVSYHRRAGKVEAAYSKVPTREGPWAI